jgi:NAD(P)-dependent dehydrogenase (short-subunit alcohol dehydrogenase family)
MQFGTNHLGHYALTNRLLPLLEATPDPPARVVTVSSVAHKTGRLDVTDLAWERRKYSRIGAYGDAKLANALFARGLAARTDPARVLSFSLHPGVIHTKLFRHLGGTTGNVILGHVGAAVGVAVRAVATTLLGFPAFKTVDQGAATSVYAALSAELGPAQV